MRGKCIKERLLSVSQARRGRSYLFNLFISPLHKREPGKGDEEMLLEQSYMQGSVAPAELDKGGKRKKLFYFYE